MTADRPKPFTFLIRGLQMTTVVERMFHVESAAERSEWLQAIEGVKKKLDENKEVEQSALAGDEEMKEASEESDPFETIFAKRGEVQKKSGSKKMVSLVYLIKKKYAAQKANLFSFFVKVLGGIYLIISHLLHGDDIISSLMSHFNHKKH